MPTSAATPRKTQSHGRIGEAAVTAKCWMNGVPAHNTNGLRANFAGSDLIVDTLNPRIKLLVQVKAGFCPAKEGIYLTQASGEDDLTKDKFHADFVVFVNMNRKIGESHNHRGTLDFSHLTYYVVPADAANKLFRDAVRREYAKPLIKTPDKKRSLKNLAVNVEPQVISKYRDAWQLLRGEPLGDT
ncbi:MAG: hypothetical protein NTZ15_16570 [Burkholderiales bacterium]|nr:hypothetical protein [Burkholderiales bacterium]